MYNHLVEYLNLPQDQSAYRSDIIWDHFERAIISLNKQIESHTFTSFDHATLKPIIHKNINITNIQLKFWKDTGVEGASPNGKYGAWDKGTNRHHNLNTFIHFEPLDKKVTGEAKHQMFGAPICLPDNASSQNANTLWTCIDETIEQLDKEINMYLGRKILVSLEDNNTRAAVYKNPMITGIRVSFLRDIGFFNGCTGEIMGYKEDRYHSLRVYIYFVPEDKGEIVVE